MSLTPRLGKRGRFAKVSVFGAKTGLIAPEETLLNKAMETAKKYLDNEKAATIIIKPEKAIKK